MKKTFLVLLFSLALTSCEGQNRPNTPRGDLDYRRGNLDYNSTGTNTRNRSTTTPFDQTENEADKTITQRIRQALSNDTSLSTNARNIKIITINGRVTLRGPVATIQEKDLIIRRVNNVQGVEDVDNQLEVLKK